MTIRVKGVPCANCGELMNAIGRVENDETPPPNDGDFAVCLYCSHIHLFEKGKIRDSTPAERDEFASNPDVMEVLMFNRAFQTLFPEKAKGT